VAQHRLSRDQVVWSFGPDLQPVLEVEPGDVVTFETNDCFTGQIRSEEDLVTEIDLTRINGATGPVAPLIRERSISVTRSSSLRICPVKQSFVSKVTTSPGSTSSTGWRSGPNDQITWSRDRR
jgi:hypothetical protein